MTDRTDRRFRSLRVSLTAACNYACVYCVPNGKRLLPAREELRGDQLFHATSLIVQAAGIEKLRITGGEPLLAASFDEYLAGAMSLPLDDVSLTTNGQLLLRKRDVLVNSGIRRINVSLDTLNPLRFRQIARGGDLDTVLRGIDAMLEAGIGIKINMVPLRTLNAGEILPMLDFCMDRGMELRYIELMNMGHLYNSARYFADFMPMDELLAAIREKYDFDRIDAPEDSTAIRYGIPGKGNFGVIANESEPFCGTCTRLRLSSDGYLYGCLSNSRRHSIRDLLDLPPEQLSLETLVQLHERLGNALADKRRSFSGETTVMKFIGG